MKFFLSAVEIYVKKLCTFIGEIRSRVNNEQAKYLSFLYSVSFVWLQEKAGSKILSNS